MKNGWSAGAFTVRTIKGEREIAGWIKGPFALDFRVFQDEWGDYDLPGWVISHIASGCVVRQLACSLAEAIDIADMILDAADWSFTDADDAKPLGRKVMAIKAKLSDGVDVSGKPCLTPFGVYDRPLFKAANA